jgi:hypothetical protein
VITLNFGFKSTKKTKQPTYTIEEKINRQNNGKFKNDKANQLPDPILMDSAEAKFQNLISQAPVLIVPIMVLLLLFKPLIK